MLIALLFVLGMIAIICRADPAGVTPAIGLGTKIEYKQTSVSGSYVEIVDVLTFTYPELQQKNAKYMPLRSTNYMQKNPATLDLGDSELTCIWSETLWAAFVGFALDTTLSLRITSSNGTDTIVVTFLLKGVQKVTVVDEDDQIKLSLEYVGPMTIA